nr:hypothetical protein [Kofleriaceae bacterium]
MPCRACGAPLPLDLERDGVTCSSCGHAQPLDVPMVRRVRAHLATLARASARAGDQASEADYYRRWRSKVYGFAAVLGLNAVMVGGGWGLVLAESALEPRLGELAAKLVVAAFAIPGMLAVLVGWPYILSRRRKIAVSPRASLGRARCAACGASVPVKQGDLPACPCCDARLLPDAASMDRARADAEVLVRATAAEAQAEREAYTTGLERDVRRGRAISAGWYGVLGTMVVLGIPLISLEQSAVSSAPLALATLVATGAAGAYAGVRFDRWRRSRTAGRIPRS